VSSPIGAPAAPAEAEEAKTMQRQRNRFFMIPSRVRGGRRGHRALPVRPGSNPGGVFHSLSSKIFLDKFFPYL
jgi:hypothetical protein